MVEVKFLTIETQNAIYKIAHRYENFEILDKNDIKNSFYKNIEIRGECDFGLERALSDFLLQENDFDVDGDYSHMIRECQGENCKYSFCD